MDTKLKNYRYSKGVKAAAVILVWLCSIGMFGSVAFLLYNQSVVTSSNYFESPDFMSEYSRLLHNVVEYNVQLKSEENIKKSSKDISLLPEPGVLQERKIEVRGKAPLAVTRPKITLNSSHETSVSVPTVEEAMESTDTVVIVEKDDTSDKLQRFYLIGKRLASTVNFSYYIKDTQTGETITNIKTDDALGLLKKQRTLVYFNQWDADSKYPMYANSIREMLTGTPYEVYAAVVEPLKPGDIFYEGFTSYSKVKENSSFVITLLVISAVFLILSLLYLLYAAGRTGKTAEIALTSADRIYTDVHTLLVLTAAGLSLAGSIGLWDSGTRGTPAAVVLSLIGIIFSIDILIGLSYVLSMARQIKRRQLLKNTLCFKIFSASKPFIALCFSGKLFKAWTLAVLLAYGMVNGILLAILLLAIGHNDGVIAFIFVLLLLICNAAALYFAAKALSSLTQLMRTAKEISSGNLDYTLDVSKLSLAFSSFAEDIHSISSGLKKAVAEAVRGERMKTDLIANVSHDLKTPLTSIISYVDLLKKEELNNETAGAYVNVLDEKSSRLKQLIEDLVEASKASSGNLAVNAEKVDLHELVMQASGEYAEKIQKAKLDVRIHTSEKKIFVLADGKHMWRILENLLSNVLKYSMPNSRVYVSIEKNSVYGILTIKNISAFPLNISPEQLTERFVRGDESRTTEGSGLGLSIAQSLVGLQGGSFKIEIDGDLFKTVVEIPLWDGPGE